MRSRPSGVPHPGNPEAVDAVGADAGSSGRPARTPMLRSRFLWKLYAGYAVLILSTVALIGGLVAKRVQEETVTDADQRLEAVAILVRDIVQIGRAHV